TLFSLEDIFSLPPIQPLFDYNNSTIHFCKNDISIDLLLFVISKSANFKVRNTIRRTWGNTNVLYKYSKLNVKLLFLVDIDEIRLLKVKLENQLFNDIVQVHLPEYYELVTYRDAAIFDYSARYCSQARYVFKTDDDVFINSLLLTKFVSQLNRTTKESMVLKCSNDLFTNEPLIMYGHPIRNSIVVRHTNHPVYKRYVVTPNEYECYRYSTFLSGFGYLISANIRSLLLCTYYRDPKPFHLSDVYFTAILAEYLNIKREQMATYNYRIDKGCKRFLSKRNSLACGVESHFHSDNNELINDYNLYWTKIIKNNQLL
ncbi:unnamed protein product, partial [Didymodactylos carnosus]